MSNDRKTVQDMFLNEARKSNVPVSIYVTNGYLINDAKVLSFDNYAVIVEVGGKQMLIYKHAISTISPKIALDLRNEDVKNEE